MAYSALVFDFFGVICSEIAPFWLREHFSEEAAHAVKADVVAAADWGTVSQVELFQELSRRTGTPASQIEAEWLAYARIDHEVVALIRRARSKFRIALLTNSPAPLFRHIIGANNLEDLFDAVVVSSEERLAKPEPAVYRLLLARLDIRPSEALMIDDNPSNVAGAEAVGMRGLLFTSVGEFRRQLEDIEAI